MALSQIFPQQHIPVIQPSAKSYHRMTVTSPRSNGLTNYCRSYDKKQEIHGSLGDQKVYNAICDKSSNTDIVYNKPSTTSTMNVNKISR